jgi:polyphosphate kinase
MHGRVEIAWPVRDPELRQRVIDECLVPYLHDTIDAWALHADGRYTRVAPAAGEVPRSAQAALVERYQRGSRA